MLVTFEGFPNIEGWGNGGGFTPNVNAFEELELEELAPKLKNDVLVDVLAPPPPLPDFAIGEDPGSLVKST